MLKKSITAIDRWIRSCGRFLLRSPHASGNASLQKDGLGPAGERLAARFLTKLGYRILERGHRLRRGEIDLIALDGKCLVFVEVKTWSSAADGDPSQAVDAKKQERLSRAALVYLKQRKLLEHPTRFDVVSIVWSNEANAQPSIRHFKSAFEAIGRGQMFR